MTDLSTPRLILEAFSPAHLDDLHALNSEPAAMRFLNGVRTREQSRAELERILAAPRTPGCGGWAVRRRADGAFLGRCGVKQAAETGEHELLYAFLSTFWGHGYATESAAAVLRHTLGLGVPVVIACAVAENTASLAVMRRIGMTLARRARMYDEDMIIYSARG